jgi:hypothetical protein
MANLASNPAWGNSIPPTNQVTEGKKANGQKSKKDRAGENGK